MTKITHGGSGRGQGRHKAIEPIKRMKAIDNKPEPVPFIQGQHGGTRPGAGRPSNKKRGLRKVVKKYISFQPDIYDFIEANQKPNEKLSHTINRLLSTLKK